MGKRERVFKKTIAWLVSARWFRGEIEWRWSDLQEATEIDWKRSNEVWTRAPKPGMENGERFQRCCRRKKKKKAHCCGLRVPWSNLVHGGSNCYYFTLYEFVTWDLLLAEMYEWCKRVGLRSYNERQMYRESTESSLQCGKLQHVIGLLIGYSWSSLQPSQRILLFSDHLFQLRKSSPLPSRFSGCFLKQ